MKKESKGPTDYGYQPIKSIKEGYQPSCENGTAVKVDNPPSGGSSAQPSDKSE